MSSRCTYDAYHVYQALLVGIVIQFSVVIQFIVDFLYKCSCDLVRVSICAYVCSKYVIWQIGATRRQREENITDISY
jgi:hypothetical protein